MSTPVRKTPSLYARGFYELAAPWTLTPNTIYICKAIRSFADLEALDVDVFDEFYDSMSLSDTVYKADRDVSAAIITLASEDASEYIYVPDTYISKYPIPNNVPYSHIVLSVSMGPLPDFVDLTVAKAAIKSEVESIIGADVTVNENRAPSSTAITPSAHSGLELTRQGGIATFETDRQRANRLKNKVDALELQVENLLQVLDDNNLLTLV